MLSDLSDGFQAFKQYVAIKNHFTSPYYDYFKYNGAVKVGRPTFDKRRDKFMFSKLAKKKDIKGFLIANFVDSKNSWVGDVISNVASDKIYLQWLGRQQSLQYIFENDLDKLSGTLEENLKVEDGQYPILLKLALRKQVSLETVIILNSFCKFFKHWSRNIEDTVIWPQFKFKCLKYKPFITFDQKTFRKIAVDKFS